MRLSVYPSLYSPLRANWFPSGANDDDLNAHRMEDVGMQVNVIQSPSILRLCRTMVDEVAIHSDEEKLNKDVAPLVLHGECLLTNFIYSDPKYCSTVC